MSDLEFLGHCGPPGGDSSRLERIRGKSSELLLAAFRLVKNALVHSIENAAVRDAAAHGAATLSSFATELGAPVSLSFLGETVFVCGQLLRAPRNVYEAATELGALLGRVGVSELTFEPGIDPPRLLSFAVELVKSIRDAETGRAVVLELQTVGVEARSIDVELLQRRTSETPAEQILRLYATALVALRELYGELAQGGTALPQRVKRIAQKLVILAEREDPAMLGMTTMAKAHRDDAGRAVQTAILSLAMARQITRDRLALSQLVVAALLLDVGRARVNGRVGDRLLNERKEGSVIPASAFACIATGGVNPANAKRTTLVTEVAWLERSTLLGAPWGADPPPYFVSSILLFAREFLERVAPRDGRPPMPHLEAVALILGRADADRVVGRLLVRALGVVPAGTVVELSTHAWAVVIGPSRVGPQASLVRVVIDAKGNEVTGGKTIDLGVDSSVWIEKLVDAKRAQFSTTGTFLGT